MNTTEGKINKTEARYVEIAQNAKVKQRGGKNEWLRDAAGRMRPLSV